MRCESLDTRLSAAVDAPADIDPKLRTHVAQCLRCQAEMARYRRLRRDLAHLRPLSTVSTNGLVDDILAALDGSGPDPRTHRRGRRAACTIAAAAGAVGAIVLANRVRVRRIAG